MFNRRYIFKGSIFHFYAGLPECKLDGKSMLPCADRDVVEDEEDMTIFSTLNEEQMRHWLGVEH